ncbi:hypothetical protein H4F18_01740 [Vibrio scophthalmi]|uniref:hypothetical protein n=1 Tax=Vibrio scophthalmi TaxID=45658 RepID=UPI002FEF5815
MSNKPLFALSALALVHFNAVANEDVQDMSDPLAVYTQAGVGYTDKGLNLKLGQAYDTGNPTTMAMHIAEVKGFLGEDLGWNGGTRSDNDNSIDSLRYRHFSVDMTNGRGSQVDVNLGFQNTTPNGDGMGTQGSVSYSFIQALPKMGPVNFYPLAGAGVAFGENRQAATDNQAQDRWDIHGTFYVVGMYSKIEVTENIWINYNPMYLGTMSGSSFYKDNAFGAGEDTLYAHEAAVSYQINPRANVRYFANWNENVNYAKGDHRIEFNYQF